MNWALPDLPPHLRAQAEAKLRAAGTVRGIYDGVAEEASPETPTHSPISKYKNKRVEYDGHKFDSIRECDRYKVLRHLESVGDISDLECQKRFPLVVNGEKICTYVADFVYRKKDGRYRVQVVEDVKGYKSGSAYRMYKVKAALMWAVHRIKVEEI